MNTTTSLAGFSTDEPYYLTATGGSGSVSPVTSQTGSINPRYIILGVTYAPPGNQSFVQYANSTMVGTSTSFTSTTSNNTGYKVAVSSTPGAKGTIPDIGGTWGWSDTTTNTYSTNFTDEQDSSSSVALSSQDTWRTKLPGPASSYVGVDHDYDVIWLWLNPLVNFTATQIGTSAATITWTGYSFDRDDIPEMDIYGVYLGWLSGHLSTPDPTHQTWCHSSEPGLNSRPTDKSGLLEPVHHSSTPRTQQSTQPMPLQAQRASERMSTKKKLWTARFG